MIRAIAELSDVESTPDEDSGFGALRTERGCLPLEAVDVRASIAGLTSQVKLTQRFVNAYDVPLEATYVFPLPERAAVTSFRLRVADRVVEGQLKERGEARREYDQAMRDGHRAAIAEEDRSGVFTMRVGNIPPGEAATVELTLVGPLAFADGEATFRFPLVAAPRYTPGVPLPRRAVGLGTTQDTDQVPDASRVTPPVLLPGFPNPVRLSFEVDFDPAGVAEPAAGWAASLRSSLHAVVVEEGPVLRLSLRPGERLNRDFLLRFPIASPEVQTTVASTGDVGGVFAATLLPPTTLVGASKPRDVVFLLDRSGSMDGWKMVAARRAVGRMLDTLTDAERFCVIAFDDACLFDPVGNGSLSKATNRARWNALEWLGKVESNGGTEIEPAVSKGLALLPPVGDRDRVLVFITDGQVTNEDSLLRSIESKAKPLPRFFTVGVDRAVNAALLHRLADMGRGRFELVETEDRLDDAMDRIHRLISTPVLTNVQIEAVDWTFDELAPSRIADLFAGCPVVVYGRIRGAASNPRLRIRATAADGKPWQAEVPARVSEKGALLPLWGRARVRDLEDAYASQSVANVAELPRLITKASLESGVLSRFTAFVAVDQAEVVNRGGVQHQVIQPVESPEGWSQSLFRSAAMMPACASAPAQADSMIECMISGTLDDDDEEGDALLGIPPARKPAAWAPPAKARLKAGSAAPGGGFFSRLFGGKPKPTSRPVEVILAECIEALDASDSPEQAVSLVRLLDEILTLQQPEWKPHEKEIRNLWKLGSGILRSRKLDSGKFRLWRDQVRLLLRNLGTALGTPAPTEFWK